MPFCENAIPSAIRKEMERQAKTLATLKKKLALTRPDDAALRHRFATFALQRSSTSSTKRRPEQGDEDVISGWTAKSSPLKPSTKEEGESWRGRLLSRVWTKPTPSRKRDRSSSQTIAANPMPSKGTAELGQYLHNVAPQIFRPESSIATAPRTNKEWNRQYLQDQGAVMGWERIIREVLKRHQVVGKARGGLIWTYASTTEGMDKADELMREEFELLARDNRRGNGAAGSKLQLVTQRLGLAICGPFFRVYVNDIPGQSFHPPIRADLGGDKRLAERTYDLRQPRTLSFLSAAAAAVRQAAKGQPIERATLLPPQLRSLFLGLPEEPIVLSLSPTPSLCRTASDESSIKSGLSNPPEECWTLPQTTGKQVRQAPRKDEIRYPVGPYLTGSSALA